MLNFEGSTTGAALLLAINALVMGFASVMLAHMGEESRFWSVEQHNVLVLAQAREALRAYRGVTGVLPCPDRELTGEGRSSVACGSVAVGLLPWRELGLAKLRDGAGGLLWYAMTSVGRLQVRDEGEVVALVIAPGPALAGQRRGGAMRRSDWLEGANAGEGVEREFQAGPGSGTFNDRVLSLQAGDG